MVPTLALRNAVMQLLAVDTATLANVAANKLCLYVNDATPSEQSIITDFTEASFTGYAAISVVIGDQNEGLVPITTDSRIDLKPPAGGFHWQATADPVTPVTVFGFMLTDNGKALLLAAERFANPVIVTRDLDVVDVGVAALTLLANSIS